MGPIVPIDSSLVRCGIAGGAARASTGYAWHGTQRQINQLAIGLSRTAKLSNAQAYSRRARLMDAIFLKVVKYQPKAAQDLFVAMARYLPGDIFAQFLSDEGGLSPCLKTIQVAPKLPFIRALWQS